jgi:hypothetical protein
MCKDFSHALSDLPSGTVGDAVKDRSVITSLVIRAKIKNFGKGSHGFRCIGSNLSFLTAL